MRNADIDLKVAVGSLSPTEVSKREEIESISPRGLKQAQIGDLMPPASTLALDLKANSFIPKKEENVTLEEDSSFNSRRFAEDRRQMFRDKVSYSRQGKLSIGPLVQFAQLKKKQ